MEIKKAEKKSIRTENKKKNENVARKMKNETKIKKQGKKSHKRIDILLSKFQ